MSIAINCFKSKCGLYLIIVIIADSKFLMNLNNFCILSPKGVLSSGLKVKKDFCSLPKARDFWGVAPHSLIGPLLSNDVGLLLLTHQRAAALQLDVSTQECQTLLFASRPPPSPQE